MKRLSLAIAAFAGLLSPALAVIQQTLVGNVAYTILSTDVNLVTTAAFSAPRSWTLPPAAATCVGQSPVCGNAMQVLDLAGAVGSTNTLTLVRQSGETINGAAADLVIGYAGARVVLIPTSGTNWQAYISPANGQAKGTATNDSASAGNVGEVISSAVATADAVSLTSTTAANITSVSLTAGDWDCRAAITRKLAASTSVTQLKTSIFTTTATSGSLDTGTMAQWSTAANVMAADTTQVIGPIRISLASTTTQYLVAQDTFSVSTNSGYGQIACRRAR